jgi:malate dehydrogenase (oxaloacetate-decarboxylating)
MSTDEGSRKTSPEELLAKATKPALISSPLHRFYEGKMQVMPKCSITSPNDFAVWYTPGVASPCREIQANPEKSFELTNRWNSIAVVSDGTRVLGLGDIGPEAAMPVMEGKAMLFKYLGGVDAVAICLKTKDPNEIVRTWKTSRSPSVSISSKKRERSSRYLSGMMTSRARRR